MTMTVTIVIHGDSVKDRVQATTGLLRMRMGSARELRPALVTGAGCGRGSR